MSYVDPRDFLITTDPATETIHSDSREYAVESGHEYGVEDPGAFWQTPTYTERDLSAARTDAWNLGYTAGVLDANDEGVKAVGNAYEDGYADGVNDMADEAIGVSVKYIERAFTEGLAKGGALAIAFVLLGFGIAAFLH